MGEVQDMVRDAAGRYVGRLAEEAPDAHLADLAHRMILSRTAAGKDRHGNAFQPYAPTTARRKGRTSPVTLRDTGQMLEAMTVEQKGGGRLRRVYDITLKGSRASQIARYHIHGAKRESRGVLPRRDFAGLAPREIAQLAQRWRFDVTRLVPADMRKRVKVKITMV